MNVAIVAMVNTTTSSVNGSVPFEQCPPVDSKGFDQYDAVRFAMSKSGCYLFYICSKACMPNRHTIGELSGIYIFFRHLS